MGCFSRVGRKLSWLSSWEKLATCFLDVKTENTSNKCPKWPTIFAVCSWSCLSEDWDFCAFVVKITAAELCGFDWMVQCIVRAWETFHFWNLNAISLVDTRTCKLYPRGWEESALKMIATTGQKSCFSLISRVVAQGSKWLSHVPCIDGIWKLLMFSCSFGRLIVDAELCSMSFAFCSAQETEATPREFKMVLLPNCFVDLLLGMNSLASSFPQK